MKFRARIIQPGMLGLTKRDLQDCGRAAIEAAGLMWHRKFKGHHFQIYAFGRYGYERRGPDYEARKKREHPEAMGRPLVFTGASERSAMASQTVDARAPDWNNYHVTCIINAPILNYRSQGEMTRVTANEMDQLQQEFAAVFERRMVGTANLKRSPLELTVRVA